MHEAVNPHRSHGCDRSEYSLWDNYLFSAIINNCSMCSLLRSTCVWAEVCRACQLISAVVLPRRWMLAIRSPWANTFLCCFHFQQHQKLHVSRHMMKKEKTGGRKYAAVSGFFCCSSHFDYKGRLETWRFCSPSVITYCSQLKAPHMAVAKVNNNLRKRFH